jgi:adenosine kinase
VCTTDADHNQIASFYPGAMAEARNIEIGPLLQRYGAINLVIVGPNDPAAMLRHTDECRTRGIPFVADPSQQLASMDGDAIRQLIDGAAYLFTNEYEAALTEQKTGWTAAEILDRVGIRVTTLGKNGAKVESSTGQLAHVGVPAEHGLADPTGVGDAFRAGYLAGVAWGLEAERCAQIGSMLATLVIETVGTQEYELIKGDFVERFADAYGAEAAAELSGVLVSV